MTRRAVLRGAPRLGLSLAALGIGKGRPSAAGGAGLPGSAGEALEAGDACIAPTARVAGEPARSSGYLPGSGLVGYAFNAKTQDVTLFDPATRQVLATKPLGTVVSWLSNEQRFWDGRYIWSYDFPEDKVRAIAVEPGQIKVARALPSGGKGPAHSVMLTPGRKQLWVNVAGGDYLAVFDRASGEVVDEVSTGKFP